MTTATSSTFKDNARAALADAQLQRAIGDAGGGFVLRRQEAAGKLPEFDALRDSAQAIKDHTVKHLDLYLEAYEQRVTAQGGHVHYAVNGDEARNIVLDLCRKAGAR
jgi:L-lactate dehydrogenase complex protein LldF